MKEKMISVLRNHAQANVHLHMMNIETYFKNPAGIGEHSDIMEASRRTGQDGCTRRPS